MADTTKNAKNYRPGRVSKRAGLVHAHLGRRFANAYGHVNSLRKAIERQVVQQFGSVSLVQQAKIQTILRLEESCRAMEKAMAESAKEMSAEEIRSNREAVSRWTAQRDNLLVALLDGKTAAAAVDPWAAIDNPDSPIPASPAAVQGDNRRRADALPHPPADRPADATAAAAAAGPAGGPAVEFPAAEIPLTENGNGKKDTSQIFPVQQNSTGGNSTGGFLEL